MPVSQKVISELQNFTGVDTTGCGDNFVGGVLASVVNQLGNGPVKPDLREACCWGIVSGGFACFYMGGTYLENKNGEKRSKIEPFYEAYLKQIGH